MRISIDLPDDKLDIVCDYVSKEGYELYELIVDKDVHPHDKIEMLAELEAIVDFLLQVHSPEAYTLTEAYNNIADNNSIDQWQTEGDDIERRHGRL